MVTIRSGAERWAEDEARALAQDLLGTAQMATEKLIERYVRPEQVKGRRRMPYSYHRRVIYL